MNARAAVRGVLALAVLCIAVEHVRGAVLPSSGTMMGAVYGNGVWVIAGSRGNLFTSTDGVEWVERDSGVDVTFYAVAYSEENDSFVAVGASMGIVWSPDQGETWVVVNPPRDGTADLKSVACLNGLYVAVTKGGSAVRSQDGEWWELVDTGVAGEMLFSIRAINGAFYSTGINKVFRSMDGSAFQLVMEKEYSTMYDIAGHGPASTVVYALVNTPLLQLTKGEFGPPLGVLRVGTNELMLAVCAWDNTFAVAATDGVYLGDKSLQVYTKATDGGRFWGIGAGGASGTDLVAVGDQSGSSFVAFSNDGGRTWT